MSFEEEYLKTGLKNREKVVFDYLFSYYYSGLCAVAYKLVGDRDLAEDIVQDLFVKLWIDAPNIVLSTSLKSYLFTAVKNRCLDLLKHEKVKASHRELLIHLGEETIEDFYFAEQELRDIIEKGIAKLPSRCGEILRMSRFDGYSNQEIADKLSISKRTVELQISNALKQLRVELKDYLPLGLLMMLVK